MTEQSRDTDFNHLIKQIFHNDDWQMRAEAARKLGFLKDGRAVNLLCRALEKESDKTVVNKIIEALGRISHPKATMRIIDFLKEELNRSEPDKYRIKIIIESLINIKDKRSLAYIGYFLNSDDNELQALAREAFDIIEPNWKEIIKKEKKEKSLQDIFK
ncbi:MAG: hypothetical protein GF317_21450 [Candidatus Lokiarchaeota archaeon]|nr:hypothetical protein [Candidatus Lokiarchaeota archaeon]MBD3202023.1 hypothetical protein [Candidatus Lokiarchaeota archaeon]